MVEITSREELEAWLKDKPADWAQVIAARAAMRVLPIALVPNYKWTPSGLQAIFRCALIFWGIKSITTDNITHIMSQSLRAIESNTGGYIPVDWDEDFTHGDDPAADAAYHAIYAATIFDAPEAATAASDAVYSADAISWDEDTGYSIVTIWESISNDALWLSRHHDFSAAIKLTGESLWLSYPVGLRISDWKKKLLALDPTYQVWIDWYNRRIEGHDAAFDIPGDTDRTHDKAILARLADATDEDFWGKGATYVNTTLQSWIEDARIEARIEEIVRKLRGGAAAHYGAPEDLAGRAILIDEIDRLLSLEQRARLGIGGNHPPEPIDFVEETKALPKELRQPLEAISTELEKREPNALIVVEQVKLLHRAGRRLEKMAILALDKYAEGFGEELGKGTAKLITRAPYLAVFIMLINQILDWLAPLIR